MLMLAVLFCQNNILHCQHLLSLCLSLALYFVTGTINLPWLSKTDKYWLSLVIVYGFSPEFHELNISLLCSNLQIVTMLSLELQGCFYLLFCFLFFWLTTSVLGALWQPFGFKCGPKIKWGQEFLRLWVLRSSVIFPVPYLLLFILITTYNYMLYCLPYLTMIT